MTVTRVTSSMLIKHQPFFFSLESIENESHDLFNSSIHYCYDRLDSQSRMKNRYLDIIISFRLKTQATVTQQLHATDPNLITRSRPCASICRVHLSTAGKPYLTQHPELEFPQGLIWFENKHVNHYKHKARRAARGEEGHHYWRSRVRLGCSRER